MSAAGELRLRGMFGTGFVSFHWQDDGIIDEEILETMRMTVLDLDEVKNIVETKIREYNQQSKSFESLKTLCNNFNKIIDTLLSLWKGTHRLHELHQFPSVTFLEHVMKRCYKRRVGNASSLQGFDKKTFLIIDALFKHFQLTEDDVLTEIDSGSGSVMLQISASSSFKCCYGIVSKNDVTSEYELMAAEFTKWMEFYGKDYTEFQLYHEDLVSNDMLKLISESTLIFLKGHNVESEMESKISLVFSQLSESCRIISFENCSQLFAFTDRTVDVKECSIGQSDVRYFLHTIKTRSVEDVTQMESQSSVTGVQKKGQLPHAPLPLTATTTTQKGFKDLDPGGITKDACKVLPSSEAPSALAPSALAPSALAASLDSILNCYRNQFIKFIEFMQTKEYRLQLGEAVKEELVQKTNLKNKIESLLLQISQLNGSSLQTTTLLHEEHGIGTNSNGEVLDEVRSLVTYNRQLKILETLLKNEISQLERREMVQDDLMGLNEKGLLKKAGDCYEKYIQLKEKVRSLEAEVATLEGRKQDSVILDVQVSTGSFTKNAAAPKDIPSVDVARQFQLDHATDASGTWSATSSPKKASYSEQHFGPAPFSKDKASIVGLSFQCPKDVDSGFFYPPALRLHSTSTSGDSSKALNGSNGRLEGFATSLNNDQCSGFSGIASIRGFANRRGSSSSTDTAESGQGLKYNAQNFDGNSVPSWPNSPDPLQPEVSRFPGHLSKAQVLRSVMEHYKPLVQSTELSMPHTFSATQSLSEEMASLSQAMPEVVSVTGRGKLASGKRGRRKRAAPDNDSKPLSVLGKRGKVTPLTSTETNISSSLCATEERGYETSQNALLEGRDLALGLRLGMQNPGKHGCAKKTSGQRTTKKDLHKAQDAGSLDALLLAVSLHHLPPSHRNLGQDLAPLAAKIPPELLREKLLHEAGKFSSAPFLPLQLGSSSIMRVAEKSPLTTLSWSLPQVSNSKPCLTMQDVLRKESPVHLTYDPTQMEALDDSHGKHFKKRCHSKNFKHNRTKKTGNTTADYCNPSAVDDSTTMPILKSLFSKRRNDDASLAPIVEDDLLEVDKRSMHLPTDAQLTTTQSKSLPISSRGHHSSLTTGTTTVSQTSNVIPKSEMSQYMNLSYPSVSGLKQQLQGVSWFSLPLSLLRQIQMSQSDTSLAAERKQFDSDALLSQSAPVFTSVSNQRTAVMSSLAISVSSSSGTIEPRDDPYKAVTKSLPC